MIRDAYDFGWSAGYRGRPFGAPLDWTPINRYRDGTDAAAQWEAGRKAGAAQAAIDLADKRLDFAKGK